MKANRLGMSFAVAAMVAVAAAGVIASDPVGVYCVVNKVVFTPDELEPTSVQIWGSCALPTGGMTKSGTYTPGWYAAPQPGYLYYTLPKGKETLAQKEWSDIKAAAGSGDVVAFGGRYTNAGRMRWADEKPAAPDVYPIQLGVTRIKTAAHPQARDQQGFSYTELFAALRKSAGVK